MDESILTSPLETNLNRLICEQFSLWTTKFKRFLSFVDCNRAKTVSIALNDSYTLSIIFLVIFELEKNKSESLGSFKGNLPENCCRWIKLTASSSAAFVELCTEEFRPKLASKVEDLDHEHRDALNSLKEAARELKEPSQKILSALTDLFDHFSGNNRSVNAADPWLNELTVRHFSARFLGQKAVYLETLHTVYLQIRHLNTELEHKMNELADEFLRILERFSLSKCVEEPHFSTELPFNNDKLNLSTWQTVLKSYSLDYDWKLQCPPLDGFLSTLYTYMKFLGASNLHITQPNSPSGLPQIFPESALKFGFLQKSVSGLISRSWQVFFAILQPNTGHLHLYKVNDTIKSLEGNLLVPSPNGSPYTKAALHDLNLLAAQFFLSSPHQPAAISPQSLSPYISIHLNGCKAVASDPSNFTFTIRSPTCVKTNLRAFCEEEFVNWVIFLNEQDQNDKNASTKSSRSNSSKANDTNTNRHHETPTNYNTDSSSNESQSQAQSFSFSPEPQSNAPVVDLENPWN